MEKQRAAGGSAGPVRYRTTTGGWKKEQRVISSLRIANAYCSSESTKMRTAETDFKKKNKTAHYLKGKPNQLLGAKDAFVQFCAYRAQTKAKKECVAQGLESQARSLINVCQRNNRRLSKEFSRQQPKLQYGNFSEN